MLQKVFLCALIVLALPMAPFAYAGKVELTTYYPAPHGEYSELSASRSFIPPRMTTVERNAITSFSTPPITQGMVIFNTTKAEMEVCVDAASVPPVWASATGGGGAKIVSATASTFSSASASWVDVVSITQDFPGGMGFAFFETKVGVSAPLVATNAYFRLLIDGVQVDRHYALGNYYAFNDTLALSWAGNLSAANHTIKVQCQIAGSGGSVTAEDTPRLTVIY